MAKKLNYYRGYGEKLISLFARLLFSKESYSLTELSRMLDCSKQTVMRLVNDIRMAYGVDIEESIERNRKYYRLVKKGKATPLIPLTESEFNALQMCKTFTEHLLGEPFYSEATRALEKTLPLLSGEAKLPSRHFASFSTGTIDYTPHQENIHALIEAMNAKKICRITYQAIMQKKAKTYHVKPLKIFSYRDTIYLHARLAKEPGKVYRPPDFDPLLAIHRLKKVEMTELCFEYPTDYDFNEVFDRSFGLVKEDSFEVEMEFQGWAADYVAERTWSPDQKISKVDDNKIRITFSASSEVELIAWILSFGEEAKVIQPEWMVEEIMKKIRRTAALYKKGDS
ncbi:MAG TPA: WYL domain-containing protein [Syntrophales bacterium]|nr:WYL domain-containing protein [Syntrophales bacterium]